MAPNKYFVPDASRPFNPKHRFFKACCCHVQKFTIAFGIVETFMVCFLLAAVIPDLNNKVCSTGSVLRTYKLFAENGTEAETLIERSYDDANTSTVENNRNAVPWYNSTGNANTSLQILHFITCQLNIAWLALAIIQIMAANIMFYGIKSKIWPLFIPHMTVRFVTIIILNIMCGLMVAGLAAPMTQSTKDTILFCLPLGIIIIIIMAYVVHVQIKAAIFTKRSAETGFSFTSTRTVTGPSQSLSDHQQQRPQTITVSMRTMSAGNALPTAQANGEPQIRSLATELPPLRHNFGIGGIGR
uniref:Uncharacterized protein n=1 Tax=Panagrellus redivivus TaxID=6233 RepID=A0A7E4V966_PANRE